MIRTKKKFGDQIYLEWIDSCSPPEWKTVEDAKKISSEVFCRTIAFYIAETKDFIIVASTIGKTKDNDVGGVSQIPKKCITKWK